MNADSNNSETKKRKKGKRVLKKKAVFMAGAISLLLIVVALYSLISFIVPTIKLKGKSSVSVEYGEEYKEAGYSAKQFGKSITSDVEVEGEVDSSKVGSYEIRYSVKKGIFSASKVRKVKVVDNVEPVITLTGEKEIKLCPLAEYEEEGFTAEDNYDGELTDKVKVEVRNDEIEYLVKDSSGNLGSVIRKLNRSDKDAPTLSLKGSEEYYVILNNKYNDPGYSASDNCDGDLTDKVVVKGNVDTSKEGKYTITYEVEDSSKNKATKTRVVTVTKEVATNDPVTGAIYLTFDDGPSGSITPQLLDILKEKGVKATFFVINHSSNLDYLIKREYDEGHTVALHSMTHDYSIYRSVDTYFDDLKQIQDKVERITGEKVMIIRFPGGSSNTVSRNYATGIMSTLTQEVLARGYHYFDWNVSSGDAGDVKTSEGVYNNVVGGLNKNKANVVLMHDFESNYKTLNAISDIIDYGKANGYQFLTIDMSTSMVRHGVNN